MAEIIPLKCEVCGCSPCETPGFCRYSKKDLNTKAPQGCASFLARILSRNIARRISLLQRQFFYSMTSKTGGGKTAIALFIAAMVALGKSEMAETIKKQVENAGRGVAGGHDTTAAYFEGDDENNNVQAGRYARMQRGLVNLPGGPTVFSSMPPGQRGGGR